MPRRGLTFGLILGVLVVVFDGAIEGFVGGFAMDRTGGACAGSLEAAVHSAFFHLTHLAPASLTILVLGGVLGAVAQLMFKRPEAATDDARDSERTMASPLRLEVQPRDVGHPPAEVSP